MQATATINIKVEASDNSFRTSVIICRDVNNIERSFTIPNSKLEAAKAQMKRAVEGHSSLNQEVQQQLEAIYHYHAA
jgi:hypothetical protein